MRESCRSLAQRLLLPNAEAGFREICGSDLQRLIAVAGNHDLKVYEV